MRDELLDLLAYELGDIYLCEEQCPGVYCLSILPTMGCGGEYYAVMKDAPISQDVRAMGRQLEGCPLLVYLLAGEDGAWVAVEYEVLKYQIQHNLPLPEGKSLREAALCGMELCPDYFGTYPVPPLTPWGYNEGMIRHLVDTVKVLSADRIRVYLRSSMEIEQTIEGGVLRIFSVYGKIQILNFPVCCFIARHRIEGANNVLLHDNQGP